MADIILYSVIFSICLAVVQTAFDSLKKGGRKNG
jgi:hypothetical protein